MHLKLLPNETILDLFDYLSINDLFYGFFNLNLRFNQLICVQIQNFHLDLRLLSKTKFHHICENYVPLIINQIISLHLSNDGDTPQQVELFLSHHYQLRHFTRLQSIYLEHLQSKQTLDQIIVECSNFRYLTHLTFTNCRISMSGNDVDRFFNHIWSLKTQTYFYFNIHFPGQIYFPNSTVISTSLRHLIVQDTSCSASTLIHLCQHTPNLEYLSITFVDRSDQLEFILLILSNIFLQSLLGGTPRLRSLLLRIWVRSEFYAPLMKTTSVSVRRLILQEYADSPDWWWFNDEQCETLTIKVENRMNILDLTNNMPNLQALNVRCEDDNLANQNNTLSSTHDELVDWLRNCLPSSCMITRDTYLTHYIRLWIR